MMSIPSDFSDTGGLAVLCVICCGEKLEVEHASSRSKLYNTLAPMKPCSTS